MSVIRDGNVLDGNAVSDRIRERLGDSIADLGDAAVTPGLATVLMSTDPASETYVSMKQRACEELGIESVTANSTPTHRPGNSTT